MVVWFFFFKQKTAYELRISDWSSDVCSSDLFGLGQDHGALAIGLGADRLRLLVALGAQAAGHLLALGTHAPVNVADHGAVGGQVDLLDAQVDDADADVLRADVDVVELALDHLKSETRRVGNRW